jgi:hypothetical protein
MIHMLHLEYSMLLRKEYFVRPDSSIHDTAGRSR